MSTCRCLDTAGRLDWVGADLNPAVIGVDTEPVSEAGAKRGALDRDRTGRGGAPGSAEPPRGKRRMDPALQAVVFFAACTVASFVCFLCGVTGVLGAHPVVAVTGGLGAAMGGYVTVRGWRFRASALDSDHSGDARDAERAGDLQMPSSGPSESKVDGCLRVRLTGKAFYGAWILVGVFIALAISWVARSGVSVVHLAITAVFAIPVLRQPWIEVRATDDELFVRGILISRHVPKSALQGFEVRSRGRRHAAVAVTTTGRVELGPLSRVAPDDERLQLLRSWLQTP